MVLAIVAAIAVTFVVFKSTANGHRSDGSDSSENGVGRGVRKSTQHAGKSSATKRSVKEMPLDIFEHLTGKDRRYAEAIQEALDADDFKATLAAVNSAMKSKNPEVRERAVEALAWFGEDALPELTGAMADPDDDVANAAENAWEAVLQEIEEPDSRFSIVASVLQSPFKRDHLVTIFSQFTSAATEMIDNEEDMAKAHANRVMVIQALVDIMGTGLVQNMQQAQEAYQEITGNEWMSIEEAERYLADPENYEPQKSDNGDNAENGENQTKTENQTKQELKKDEDQ